jgi:hypothetical protein
MEEDLTVNSHLVTLFVDDIKRAIATLLDEIKPRLIPHLPARAPAGPQNITVMGGPVREVVMRVTPIWRGNTRVTVEGDLIVVEARTTDGWIEPWRSDCPDAVVQQRAAAPAPTPAPAPAPAPEAAPELTSRSFGPVQPGQVIEVNGRFTVAK